MELDVYLHLMNLNKIWVKTNFIQVISLIESGASQAILQFE